MQVKFETTYKEMIVGLMKDIGEKNLAADKLIAELFEESELITHSDSQVDRAKKRMELGNPPGKNGSLGDALNWEMLMDYTYSSWSDLHLISSDKDYNSCLYEETLNDYLNSEWTTRTQTKISFYNRLSSFFKQNFPYIEFDENIERQINVYALCASSSYKETHNAMIGLVWYDTFSKREKLQMFDALINNSQINSIAGDKDIRDFYVWLYDSTKDQLNPEIKEKIIPLLWPRSQRDTYADDIPF
jgi:hypothetical protein